MEAIGHGVRVPPTVLLPAFRQAVADGYLAGTDDGWELTVKGRAEFEKFSAALKDWLCGHLPVPGPDDVAELDAALRRLTGRLLDEETTAPLGGRMLALATRAGE
jgi:hypothetical protein